MQQESLSLIEPLPGMEAFTLWSTIHLNRTWLYGRVGEGKSEESRKPVAMRKRIAELLLEWHRRHPADGLGIPELQAERREADFLQPVL